MTFLKKLTLRGKLVLGLVASLLATPAILGSGVSSAVSSQPTPQLGIPAYFWQSEPWQQIITAPRKPAFVVANPSSGPGEGLDVGLAARYQQVAASGISVFGYVHTSYSARPLEDVLSEVEKYRTWYGINDIFLDETPPECEKVPYYASIVATVHQNGGTAILNPGMNLPSCWAGVAEGIVNFEGSASTYASWQPATWASTPSATSFWHIIYGADSANAAQLLEMARLRNASSVYITDDMLLPEPVRSFAGNRAVDRTHVHPGIGHPGQCIDHYCTVIHDCRVIHNRRADHRWVSVHDCTVVGDHDRNHGSGLHGRCDDNYGNYNHGDPDLHHNEHDNYEHDNYDHDNRGPDNCRTHDLNHGPSVVGFVVYGCESGSGVGYAVGEWCGVGEVGGWFDGGVAGGWSWWCSGVGGVVGDVECDGYGAGWGWVCDGVSVWFGGSGCVEFELCGWSDDSEFGCGEDGFVGSGVSVLDAVGAFDC